MKTFLRFLNEMAVISHDLGTENPNAKFSYPTRAGRKIEMGSIHPDYSMVHTTSDGHGFAPSSNTFHIVHKQSNSIVGQIHTQSSLEDGSHEVMNMKLNADHRKSKIGHSLAVAAYKHISNAGHTLRSGVLQSAGGASIWNALRRDPETKHRVFVQYNKRNVKKALHLPAARIWATDVGLPQKRKGIKPLVVDPQKRVSVDQHNDIQNIRSSHLVLRPPSTT